MPNFSSLAGLEVSEKFVGGVVGVRVLQVATVSNLNTSCFRVALSSVTLGFDNMNRILHVPTNLIFKP